MLLPQDIILTVCQSNHSRQSVCAYVLHAKHGCDLTSCDQLSGEMLAARLSARQDITVPKILG